MDKDSSYVLLPTWNEQKKSRGWNPISMKKAQQHLPEGYSIRLMSQADYAQISGICRMVYPTERPYSDEELSAHHQLFPDSDSIALSETQLSHHPSGSSSGRTVSPEDRELGLAGFEPQDGFKPLSCEAPFYLPLRVVDGFRLAFTFSRSDFVVSRILCDIDSLCLR